MPILSHPAFGPKTALAYVTGGSLLCIWTLVWYFTRDYEPTRNQWFWIAGLFLTGITFIFLGLVLGPLGRAARQAELPPESAIRAEAAIQQTAAANPQAVAAAVPPGGVLPTTPVAAAPVVPTQPAPAR
jgi:hypothetical protein